MTKKGHMSRCLPLGSAALSHLHFSSFLTSLYPGHTDSPCTKFPGTSTGFVGSAEMYLLPSLLVHVDYLLITVCLLVYSFLQAKFQVQNGCLSHMFRKNIFICTMDVLKNNCRIFKIYKQEKKSKIKYQPERYFQILSMYFFYTFTDFHALLFTLIGTFCKWFWFLLYPYKYPDRL